MKILDINRDETRVVALGGLGEVGKNMYVIMHDDELIILDAGVMFPKDELLGIDYVIPDFTFLKENENFVQNAETVEAVAGCGTRRVFEASYAFSAMMADITFVAFSVSHSVFAMISAPAVEA